MRSMGIAIALLVGVCTIGAVNAVADESVALLDECNPATFNAKPPVGPGLGIICDVDFDGEVTFKEFVSQLPPGHPAWRFEPSSLKVQSGEKVQVENDGGEVHTFTEVKVFGGGFVAALNGPLKLTPVPECGTPEGVPNPALVFLNPDHEEQVKVVGTGPHLFQCCIHPWMKAVIKVNSQH